MKIGDTGIPHDTPVSGNHHIYPDVNQMIICTLLVMGTSPLWKEEDLWRNVDFHKTNHWIKRNREFLENAK